MEIVWSGAKPLFSLAALEMQPDLSTSPPEAGIPSMASPPFHLPYAISFAAIVLSISLPLQAEDTIDYASQIKPLFKSRCIACHGVLKQEAGLRLDTAEFFKQGGDDGPVVDLEDASRSRILDRVTSSDPDQMMPPDGERLTADQVSTLQQWIANGAIAPSDEQPESDPREHWAYQKINRPTIPNVDSAHWGRNPIDSFLMQYHRQHDLTPQIAASKLELIRRLYIDLIGLPPTLEELQSLEQEWSEEAYQAIVERLLNDPRHGERWARHWMDIWRYSDWWGLGDQLRNSQKHIWHWRDWMIESLNSNLPYDEMIRLMLAADELYPNDPQKLRATGFLARNYFLFNRHQWMDETIEHVSKGFLGITMNCAKCHDHKYDPIEQEDYYRMRAFFEPYHVRLDMVPQELDFNRNGIPRVYDGVIDAPTYRFIQGNENQPDKSKAISPGIPDILAFQAPVIEEIQLPVVSWQPESQPWVRTAYVEAAEKRVALSEANLTQAQGKLEEARRQAAQVPKTVAGQSTVIPFDPLVEEFDELDQQRWKTFGGQWLHEKGQLSQTMDGPTRSILRLEKNVARDFDAQMQFTIHGGSQWRSVCLEFDSIASNPGQATASTDHGQTIYVSAYAGGPKVQASYFKEGQWQYPANGFVSKPIELEKEYTLRVQVRGNLVNVSLNGEFLLAWQSPIPRIDGALQLTTFDALASFQSFSIEPLADHLKLQEPSGGMANQADPIQLAELEYKVAERQASVAKLELESSRARFDALQETWMDSNASQEESAERKKVQEEKRVAAIQMQRRVASAKLRQQLAAIDLKLLTAPSDQHEAIRGERENASANLLAAEMLEAQPTTEKDQVESFAGAQWSATRFLSSLTDDPNVPFPRTSSGRRKALAEWITHPDHPLTARVAVNHLWTRHMGSPLVMTTFDFGRNGTPPVHRELLDWLAIELIESGWNMKHIHRLIVSSEAYRMSSSVREREKELALDPENRGWWRRTPIRLESQVVRDTILAISGTLDETRFGPSVMPDQQTNSMRRSLYFFHSNNDRNLFLTTFDEALVKECYRREQSIVPQQALALTNSQIVLDSSMKIAERISGSAERNSSFVDDESFVRRAFQLVLGMSPSESELRASLKSLELWRSIPEAKQGEERSYLIWTLLNHNDFVTLR